jgi:hypothetical protein
LALCFVNLSVPRALCGNKSVYFTGHKMSYTYDTRRQRKTDAIKMLERVLWHDLSPVHIRFSVYNDCPSVIDWLSDDSILFGSKISTYLDIFKNRILSHYHSSHIHPCPHHDNDFGRFFHIWFDRCERCFVVTCNCCKLFEISLDKYLEE